MFGCLVDAKYNMTAKVLTPASSTKDEAGHYINVQDEDTGEIHQVWVADQDATQDGVQARFINCMVRPVLSNKTVTEVFTKDGLHDVVELVQMNFPTTVVLSTSDRIAEIRNDKGYLLWAEEVSNGDPANFKSTVFDIVGIGPIIDPFGNHVENVAYMKRAGVQSG